MPEVRFTNGELAALILAVSAALKQPIIQHAQPNEVWLKSAQAKLEAEMALRF